MKTAGLGQTLRELGPNTYLLLGMFCIIGKMGTKLECTDFITFNEAYYSTKVVAPGNMGEIFPFCEFNIHDLLTWLKFSMNNFNK